MGKRGRRCSKDRSSRSQDGDPFSPDLTADDLNDESILEARVMWAGSVAMTALSIQLSKIEKANGRQRTVMCLATTPGSCPEFMRWCSGCTVDETFCKISIVPIMLSDRTQIQVPPFGGISDKELPRSTNLVHIEQARLLAMNSMKDGINEQFKRNHRVFRPPMEIFLKAKEEGMTMEKLKKQLVGRTDVNWFHSMRSVGGIGLVNPTPHTMIASYHSLVRKDAEIPYERVLMVSLDPNIIRSKEIRNRIFSAFAAILSIWSLHREVMERIAKSNGNIPAAIHPEFVKSYDALKKTLTEALQFGNPDLTDDASIEEHLLKHEDPTCPAECRKAAHELYTTELRGDTAKIFTHQGQDFRKSESGEVMTESTQQNDWGFNAYQRALFRNSHADSTIKYDGLTNLWMESPALIWADNENDAHLVMFDRPPSTMEEVNVFTDFTKCIEADFKPDSRTSLIVKWTVENVDFTADIDLAAIKICSELGISILFTKYHQFWEQIRVTAALLTTGSHRTGKTYIHVPFSIDIYADLFGQIYLDCNGESPHKEIARMIQAFVDSSGVHPVFYPVGYSPSTKWTGYTFDQVVESVWPGEPWHETIQKAFDLRFFPSAAKSSEMTDFIGARQGSLLTSNKSRRLSVSPLTERSSLKAEVSSTN